MTRVVGTTPVAVVALTNRVTEPSGEIEPLPLRPPMAPRLGNCESCGGWSLHRKGCPNIRTAAQSGRDELS